VDLLDQTLVPLARAGGRVNGNGAVNGNGHGSLNGHGHHAEPLDVRAVVATPEPSVAQPEPLPLGQPMHARWIAEYLQPTHVKNLRLLTSGPLPPNPAELLASPRLANCLQHLTTEADIVVIDSPPVLVVSDPLSLASRVDATMLVVNTQRTRTGSLQRTTEALNRSGTRILGAVLNNVRLGVDAGLYYAAYHDLMEEKGGGPAQTQGASHGS
jgi:Mrp family chromosome partitioning ATPase